MTCVAANGKIGWTEEVIAAAERMTGYKRPRLFAEVPEIWRNGIGKVDRRRIVDHITSNYEIIDGPYPREMGNAGHRSSGHRTRTDRKVKKH